jgi:hypothetical protein
MRTEAYLGRIPLKTRVTRLSDILPIGLFLDSNYDFLKNEVAHRNGAFFSAWKPTHLTSVFALWTSILQPDGTMLMALIQMLNMDVCSC